MIGNPLLLSFFGILTCFLAGTVAREAMINAKVAKEWKFFHEKTVSVQIHDRHICGGGIIGNRRFVLTAAYCFVNRTRHLRSTHISVLARTYNLHKTDPPAVRIPVETVFVPKDFDPQIHTVLVGDIAVLKLAHSLPELQHSVRLQLEHDSRNLRELKLPPNSQRHSIVVAAGFGWSNNDVNNNDGFNAVDGRLRFAFLDEVTAESGCQSVFPHGAIHFDVHLCARALHHLSPDLDRLTSVCTGDTGAPLMSFYNDDLYVYGVLSRIPDDCDDRRQPAVFTLVRRYAKNIRNVMEHGHDADMISLQAN